MTKKSQTTKSIFVTGAGSGIGKAIAQHFLAKGWFVAATDINGDGLLYLKSFEPSQVFAAVMDVSDPESVKQVFSEYGKLRNTLDLLVNNAGVLQMGLFKDLSLEDHLKTINVNFSGVVSCSYIALPFLQATNKQNKAQQTTVINISSSSAAYGVPDFSVYSATKNAVSALTEALNIEFKKDDIHVCDVQPLFVSTPMLESDYKGESLKLMGVHLKPEDIAETVWQAAHQERLHWAVGTRQKIMNATLAMVPFAKHFMFARLMPK